MKEKTAQEQTAAARQVELLTEALQGASTEGYWLNVSGRQRPRIYPQNTALSPFNSLILGIHADNNGYDTALYTTFNDTRKQGNAVLKEERSVPMNWYRWDKYVNRHDDKDIISREQYLELEHDRQRLYKGVRQREIRPMFNLQQTTFPFQDQASYDRLKMMYGGITDRGNLTQEERQLRQNVAFIRSKVSENVIPIRKATTGIAGYDSVKDAVYMPDQKHYEHYNDYVQDLLRQIVEATGHRERNAREGMVMRGGVATADAMRYEQLINELASGVKMMELGLPAKLSPQSMQQVEYWSQQLRENPCMIDAVESDVNNALEIIHKAEMGERVEFQSDRNRQQTQEFRDKEKPQVSSEEGLIMLDILAHGGMEINPRNFKSQEEMAAFMEKFSMTEYNQRMEDAFGIARSTADPEGVNIAYTEAANASAHIYNIASEMYPQEGKGAHAVVEQIQDTPNKQSKTFVVVRDKESGIADVILPGAARSGGDVVMPNGDRRNFWLTPDEVMSAEERKEAGARVVSHNLPGMNKEKIAEVLRAEGVTQVRFFTHEGTLAYHPDDSYFAGKEVYAAQLSGKQIITTSTFDVSEAVSLATEARFDRVQMLKDDAGKWALLLKPENEPSFAVYPDKEDTNRFFSTIRQNDPHAGQAVRNELAQKYYALAKANPELRKELFGQVPDGIDPRQIERVNIFKTKDGKYMCMPKIQGADKLQPREITSLQWQRLWAADDVAKYKTALAATLFADVLQQKNQEETVAEHHEEQQKEQEQPEEQEKVDDFPNLKQVDELKSKHPDAIILMRHNDFYESYKDDATRVAEICSILPFERVRADTNESVRMVSFPAQALDTYLPKMIRAGERIAICDALERSSKTEESRVKGKVNADESERRSGMRI
jgi:antirestriction protein ArdC